MPIVQALCVYNPKCAQFKRKMLAMLLTAFCVSGWYPLCKLVGAFDVQQVINTGFTFPDSAATDLPGEHRFRQV